MWRQTQELQKKALKEKNCTDSGTFLGEIRTTFDPLKASEGV